MSKPPRIDVQTANLGSIWTFYPVTARGRRWITRYLDGETVCEYWYGYDIAEGMLNAGLILEDAATGRTAVRNA